MCSFLVGHISHLLGHSAMPYCHRALIPVLSDPRKVWSDLSSHFSLMEYWLNGILFKLLTVAKNQCLLLLGAKLLTRAVQA